MSSISENIELFYGCAFSDDEFALSEAENHVREIEVACSQVLTRNQLG